jgi:hypothetical protein
MAIDRDPIHLFLEYQLPQMISQAKEAEKNRMHEKDMVQVREDSRMRTIEHEAQLNDERALNKLNYELALKDREEKLQTIKTGQQKLMEQGIMLEQFQKIKEEDTSTGGTEIFKLVQGETERELLNNLDQFNSLEEGIAQINTKDAQLDETIDILQRVQVAQNIGANIGSKVTDLTGDDNVTEEDFLSYIKLYQDLEQPLFDTSTVEGQLQQQAFMEQIPTLEEGLKYGSAYRQNKLTEAKIKDYNSKAMYNEFQATRGNIKENSRKNTFAIKNLEAQYDNLPQKMKDATNYNMPDMKLAAGHTYSKEELEAQLAGLQRNITNQLIASERGVGHSLNPFSYIQSTESTHGTLEDILVDLKNVDPDNKEANTAMMESLNNYLMGQGVEGLEAELDYSNMPFSGDETKAANYILDEVRHYRFLQDIISQIDDPADIPAP